MNRDTKAFKIRELTLELLGDGKVHTTKEIMDIAIEKEIILDKKTDVVYNVLFHMKKNGLIVAGPDKSQYIIGNVDGVEKDKVKKRTIKKEAEEEKEQKVSMLNLDKDRFSLLQPSPSRYSKMIFTVKENGELKMNGALMSKIKDREIEIFISKDLRTIILNPAGVNTHKFTKAGITKNREIVSMLKKLKIRFPITYAVSWSESVGAWEGVLEVNEKV